MPLIDFFIEPNKIQTNEIMVLKSAFTEVEGTVVYQIAESSRISFANGLQKIESPINGARNLTSTILEGTKGGVMVKAYIKNSPETTISRLARLI